jgi:hypothetical protein
MVVTFSKTRKVRVVPKIKNSDKERVWWNANDFKKIRRQCVETARLGFKSSKSRTLSSNHCLRGLENWSLKRYNARRKLIKDAVLLVLSEQECMKHQGINDPFAFSSIYGEFATESQRKAHLRGLADEQGTVWQSLENDTSKPHPFTGKRSYEDTCIAKPRSFPRMEKIKRTYDTCIAKPRSLPRMMEKMRSMK